MTAEIAIMNKAAVALAADSAVTIGGDRNRKIFNTVNKLFTLSKHYPVGIMVYGNAQIMNVPWETIIKLYRQKLGTRHFNHLEEYAKDFLRFLAHNRALFPAYEQRNYFQGMVSALFRSINDDINGKVQEEIAKSGECTTDNMHQIVSSQIEEVYAKIKKVKTLKGFSEQVATRLRRKFKDVIQTIQTDVFQKLPLDSTDQMKLEELAGWLFTRDCFRVFHTDGVSGVVIAGFGEKDIYPRLREFLVEGVIGNKLRACPQRDVQISPRQSDASAAIIPFAQSQVVQGFMEGIDPALERVLDQFLKNIFGDYPNILLKHIPNLNASSKAKAAKKMAAANNAILKKFKTEFDNFRQQTLVRPVISTVAVLPKDELAAMAEALVSVTSFKRKFSPDAETVGGPIDVAVLSKGDGFVWIKRKHYFKPELNPHFLTNYFQNE